MASFRRRACFAVEPLRWHQGREGIVEIGAADDGFAFDCERPRHRVFLDPHAIANRARHQWRVARVHRRRRLSHARALAVRRLGLGAAHGIDAPLYWREDGTEFTLAGRREIDRAAPVAHVSFFEADAFARWAGARLPTEAEWEDFAASPIPTIGNQLDTAGGRRCRAPAAACSATSGNGRERLRFLSRLRAGRRRGRRI